MASYQVLYWHDIPVQVRAKGEGGRASMVLPERFQEAVDLAAMSVGLIGSDEYTDAFRWGEPQLREGDSPSVVAAVVAEFDQQYPRIDWRATANRIRAQVNLAEN